MPLKQSRLLKLCFRQLPASLRLKSLRFLEPGWYDRIHLALSCPDSARVPKVPQAGQVRDGLVIMHNGLLIHRGSYHGETLSVLLELNGAVHEPQEEYVFHEVLQFIPPGGTMLELGAYWGFYSMWFAQRIPSARCILVEPDPHNLERGKANFALNKFAAEFLQGYSGSASPGDGIPVYSVDELIERDAVKTLHVLHADIQGAELDMLRGAESAFARQTIDYAFIFTHTDQLMNSVCGFCWIAISQ
jgi:hypothetical protein